MSWNEASHRKIKWRGLAPVLTTTKSAIENIYPELPSPSNNPLASNSLELGVQLTAAFNLVGPTPTSVPSRFERRQRGRTARR